MHSEIDRLIAALDEWCPISAVSTYGQRRAEFGAAVRAVVEAALAEGRRQERERCLQLVRQMPTGSAAWIAEAIQGADQ